MDEKEMEGIVYPAILLVCMVCLVVYTLVDLILLERRSGHTVNDDSVPLVVSQDLDTLKATYDMVLTQIHTQASNEHGMDAATFKTYIDLVAYINSSNPKLSATDVEDMAKAIIKNSHTYDLPVGLVASVTNVESRFRADAVGPKTNSGNALGAMQVMWPLHKDLAHSMGVKKENILTADGGIKIGCYLLRRYIQKKGSIFGGLAHYFSAPSKRYVLDKVTI